MKKWYFIILIFFLGFLGPGGGLVAPPSDSSKDFLLPDKYTDLEIEIIYEKLMPPNLDSVACLVSTAKLYCHKTSIKVIRTEISVITSQNFPCAFYGNIWTSSILSSFTKICRTKSTRDNILVLHILYLPGYILEDVNAIGEAFADDAFVIFRWRVSNEWESSVLVHEFGHIMGLVDPKSKHHDNQHKWHCANKNCVMYWCIEEADPTITFDNSCKKLLYARGAKQFY